MTFVISPPGTATSPHRTALCAAIALCLVLPAVTATAAGPPCGSPPCAAPPVPAAATVTVDCDQGDSVQDALATPAGQLTVQIRGICQEDVAVERDDVVLSGRDPALDGLRGAATALGYPANVSHAVLRISGAERVRVENLSIADGVRNGIQVEDTSQAVDVVGCEITGMARDGLQATFDSTLVRIEDSTLTGHARAALSAFGADLVECVRCVLDGDEEGVLSVGSSRVVVTDSTVDSGQFAVIAAEGGALVSGTDSTFRSAAWAFGAQAGRVGLSGGAFEGSVLAQAQGLVTLNGASHDANLQGFNVIDSHSAVRAVGSTLQGFTIVEDFSEVVLRDGSALDGDLVCQLGGDGWCADPVADVTGSANCGQCTTPAAAPATAASRTGGSRADRPRAPELTGFVP